MVAIAKLPWRPTDADTDAESIDGEVVAYGSDNHPDIMQLKEAAANLCRFGLSQINVHIEAEQAEVWTWATERATDAMVHAGFHVVTVELGSTRVVLTRRVA